ncbi:MAG TPA: hypothetical protein VH682_32250 [Gemmataceae bacterium]|jgi:hypothetical protein
MSTEALKPRTLIDWTEMFAVFERNLDQWLTQTVESPSEPPTQREDPVPLRMFEERLKHLQTYLDRAEVNAEQAMAPLTTEIQALRQWLDALNMARAKLVERTVSEVREKVPETASA